MEDKEYTKDDYFKDEFAKEEPKQETLEEAADKIFFNCSGDMTKSYAKKKAIELAKWQQEQDKNKHSDEDMISAIQYTVNNFFNGKLAGLNSEEIFEQFKNK